MFDIIRKLLNSPAPTAPADPCEQHRNNEATLLAELDQGYHRERQLRNSLARLQAENLRLQEQNLQLSRSQQQLAIEELADRIIARKHRRETPALRLPCSQHRNAGMQFNLPGENRHDHRLEGGPRLAEAA